MKHKPKIIVVTGAESTGKSTLTKKLSEHFDVPFVPEIARDYIEKLKHNYTFSDVEKIAKVQIEMFEKYSNSDAPYVIMDTWLIITKVWFEFVYQKVPDWLLESIEKYKIDLFLLCDIDIPWIDDPVRENGGLNRKKLHEKYIENLNFYKFNFEIVKGLDEMRFLKAIKIVNELNDA